MTDVEAWTKTHRDWFDPFWSHRVLWPDRKYAIDFSTAASLDYVPVARTACLLSGDEIVSPGLKLKLNPLALLCAQLVDGRRTIRQIMARVATRGDVTHESEADLQDYARKLFESRWRLDFLAMGLKPARLANEESP